MKKLALVVLVIGPRLLVQDGKVAPTWLRRYVPEIQHQRGDLTTRSRHFLPILGEVDSEARAPQTVARFGEMTVETRSERAVVVLTRRLPILQITRRPFHDERRFF